MEGSVKLSPSPLQRTLEPRLQASPIQHPDQRLPKKADQYIKHCRRAQDGASARF
jgi:hypothetical protein